MISGTGSRLLVTENGFGYVMLVCLAQTKCLWELNSSPNSRLIEGWEVGCEIIQGMDRESENRGETIMTDCRKVASVDLTRKTEKTVHIIRANRFEEILIFYKDNVTCCLIGFLLLSRYIAESMTWCGCASECVTACDNLACRFVRNSAASPILIMTKPL
jgi:hypothetical protein